MLQPGFRSGRDKGISPLDPADSVEVKVTPLVRALILHVFRFPL